MMREWVEEEREKERVRLHSNTIPYNTIQSHMYQCLLPDVMYAYRGCGFITCLNHAFPLHRWLLLCALDQCSSVSSSQLEAHNNEGDQLAAALGSMGSLPADSFSVTRSHVDTDRPSTRDSSRPLSRDFSALSNVGAVLSSVVLLIGQIHIHAAVHHHDVYRLSVYYAHRL